MADGYHSFCILLSRFSITPEFRISLKTLWRFGIFFLGCFATGCVDRTAILLEFRSSDLRVPEDVDAIRVFIRAAGKQTTLEEKTIVVGGGAAGNAWPQSLTVLPNGISTSGDVWVETSLLLGGNVRLTKSTVTRFIQGTQRKVIIDLQRSCLGIVCEEGLSCVSGMCTPDSIDTDAGVDAGSDGGMDTAPEIGTDTRDASDSNDTIGSLDTTDTHDTADVPPPLDGGVPQLVINELDYDQVGMDTQEYIEIFNTGTNSVDMANISVLLINGAAFPAEVYETYALAGVLGPGQYAVLHGAGLTLMRGHLAFNTGQVSFIQNGTALTGDAVVLFDRSRLMVLDAVCYEGDIAPFVYMGVMVDPCEGGQTPFDDNDTEVFSFSRVPNGRDTNNAPEDWWGARTLTPGFSND